MDFVHGRFREWMPLSQLIDDLPVYVFREQFSQDFDFIERIRKLPFILLNQTDEWLSDRRNETRIMKMYCIAPLASSRDGELFTRLSSLGFFKNFELLDLSKRAIDSHCERITRNQMYVNCLRKLIEEPDEEKAISVIKQMDSQFLNMPNADGRTVVHIAALYNRKIVLKALVEKGWVDFSLLDVYGDTPLLIACMNGFSDFALFMLLKIKGLDVNCRERTTGLTPLHHAFEYCRVQLCKVLLEKGANMYQKSNDGFSPFKRALEDNPQDYNKQCCSLVFVEAIKPREMDARDERGYTVLHRIAEFGWVSAFVDLLNKGADPTLVSKNGMTVLHVCCVMNQQQCALMLIPKMSGDALNMRDFKKHTALWYASGLDNLRVVKALFAKGAAPLTYEEWDALMWYKDGARPSEELLFLLVRHIDLSEVEQKDLNDTLEGAVMNNAPDIVEYLLARGANIDHVDEIGLTMFDLAETVDDNEELLLVLREKIGVRRTRQMLTDRNVKNLDKAVYGRVNGTSVACD